ncbi:ABC transporter permease [Breznakiella homolactica]|uniref:ABC transporter permease subunit n=1 Tax=Breznakiella homolactica TaxID=2798577 RepID=A0A7T7XKM3_9SPIR|nr:ABC transporter permease subunit [Breznakiella homolactica]QQO07988.1 ABC transporter permease subunit [Breznakiella homolactica]
MGEKKNTSLLWVGIGVAVLVLFWQIASVIAGSDLLLPGPVPVIRRLAALAVTEPFLSALGFTFLRVMWGIILSAPLGVIVGVAAGLDRRVSAFVRPFFSVVSATPVMSVILIAFLWFGQERTPVFTAFLMVFPVMVANTIEGIKSVDPGLREVFRIYGMSRRKTLTGLYIPSILPFLLAGLRSSLSLCWKVVVAAEVIVQPFRALGTGMQQAKAQLETPELFAWTAATVIAAACTEFILSRLLSLLKIRGAAV